MNDRRLLTIGVLLVAFCSAALAGETERKRNICLLVADGHKCNLESIRTWTGEADVID